MGEDFVAVDEMKYGYHVGGLCRINFQRGNPKECGKNGVTEKQLLAVVLDRLGAESKPGKLVKDAIAAIKD